MAPYGQDQAQFIQRTRNSVDKNPSFLDCHDWRNVTPRGGCYHNLRTDGRVYTGSFYVKPIVMFVPHLIIPGHLPTCPHCETGRYIDKESSRWIDKPKIVFGINTHKYLDTKLYYCRSCARHFSGLHKRSLELDAHLWVGLFDLHLTTSFAVDSALYSDIINSTDQTPTAIARRYEKRVVDKYLSDYHMFLYLVRSDKIRHEKSNAARNDRHQSTLDKHLVRKKNLTANQLTQRTINELLRNKKLSLMAAEEVAAQDICFDDVLSFKAGRNNRNAPIKGLGVAKIEELKKVNVRTGQQLLNFYDVNGRFNRHVLEGWKRKVKEVFRQRKARVDCLKEEVKQLETQLEEVSRQVLLEASIDEQIELDENEENDNNIDNPINNDEMKPPKFSTVDDTLGYNARFLSRSRIESILRTEFQHRRQVQDSKIRGLQATVLRMDFNYKIAAKVRVYKGRGMCFQPFKCLCTIQNEDALTVFWKALRGSESIREIYDDLIRLRDRLAINGSVVKLVYVDNCCTTGNLLRQIFGDIIMVKLDAFHWLKRWDAMLDLPSSEHAIIFRTLMSRAIFNVEESAYIAAKNELFKKNNRIPTTKEILRAANSVIPGPAVLRANVEAVLKYCSVMDLKAELLSSIARNDPDRSGVELARPKKFFRDCAKTRDSVIKKQLKHVDNGCLSDPPPDVFNIFRKNPVTGKTFVARGTSTNESDNLHLDRLTGNNIGLSMAERLIANFVEQNNDRKKVQRLGEKDNITNRSESLSLLNTYAEKSGYEKDDLPFPDLSVPTEVEQHPTEYIGFQYNQQPVDDISNPAHSIGNRYNSEESTDETDANDSVSTLANFLQGIDFEEEQNDDSQSDVLDIAAIEEKALVMLPEIAKRETTLQAFIRLTNNQPWIPFHTGTTNKRAIDFAEEAHFESMMNQHGFNPKAKPTTAKGFKTFESLWNQEVGRRFKLWTEGEENVVLLNMKSARQLEEHYKSVEAKGATAHLFVQNNPFQHEMNSTFRNNRACLPPTAPPTTTTPVAYLPGRAPLGTPAALNPNYIAPVLQHKPGNAATPSPWLVARVNQPLTPTVGMATGALENFNRRTWCISCGHRKKDHSTEERFGSKCKKTYCAKCRFLKQHHQSSHGKMGPYCRNPAKPDSPHPQWYH